MNAAALASAQLDKASHQGRCEAASQAVCQGAALLAQLARGQAPQSELDILMDCTVAAFREQLRLIVQGADIDRRIQEAQNG